SPNYSYSLLNNISTVLEGPKSNDLDDSIQFRTNPISAPSKFNIQVISDTLLNFGTGNSLIFDGNNDRVNCGNDPSVQITGNQITLEAWVYPIQFRNYVHEAHIISKETNSPDYGFMLRTGDNGRLNFNAGNGNWNETTTPNSVISLNKWQHVAATYDGVTTRIYVNGTEVHSQNRTFTIGNSGNNLTIGGYPNGGGNFNGRIDEVKVWN